MLRINLILLTLFFTFIASCQKDNDIQVTSEEELPSTSIIELVYPDQQGQLASGYLGNQLVEYRVVDGNLIFEGDIFLSEDQITQTLDNTRIDGAGRSRLIFRWPDNIVPYVIDNNLPNKYRVIDAMAHWEDKTSIKFVPHTNETHYIRFMYGNGCGSYVGMLPWWSGGQPIRLGNNCSTGTTIHEIGHAVGLWHEHSRADRDKYVKIFWSNMIFAETHAFRSYIQNNEDGFDHGPFDFESIMMYPYNAFSRNGQPTITKLDGSLYRSNRHILSSGDIAIIDNMYGPKIVEVQFLSIIENFDEFIGNKEIFGVGRGNSAKNRLKTFKNKLIEINEAVAANNLSTACDLIADAQKHIHLSGRIHPSHFISGSKTPNLNGLLNLFKVQKCN